MQELVLRHLAVTLDLRWLVKEYNPLGDWRAYMKFVPDAWRDAAGRP